MNEELDLKTELRDILLNTVLGHHGWVHVRHHAAAAAARGQAPITRRY